MHDYDRRPTASFSETVETSWYALEIDRVVSQVLRSHAATVATLKHRKVGPLDFEATGTTTDGRTFEVAITFSIGEDYWLKSSSTTTFSGAADVGPVPAVLSKVAESVASILTVLAGIDSPDGRLTRSVDLFERHYKGFVLSGIEDWQRGAPVDKARLRSSLRESVKKFQAIATAMGDDVRTMVPRGQSKPLWQLLDATRKALNAAVRDVK